jgi:hypothetical protein
MKKIKEKEEEKMRRGEYQKRLYLIASSVPPVPRTTI